MVSTPDEFVPGANSVAFTGPDGTTCTTTVTLLQPKRHLAFSDGNSTKVVRIDDGQLEWESAGRPRSLQYDSTGTILGINRAGGVTTFDAQTGAVLQIFGGHFSKFAFRPTDSRDVAFIKAPQAAFGAFELEILFDNGAFTEQSIAAPLSAGAFIVDPKIAWSRDGQRIAVAFNILSNPNVFVVYREWAVTGTTLGQPVVSLEWNPVDWLVPAGSSPAKDMVIDLALLGAGSSLARMMGTTNGLYRVDPNLAQPPRTVHRSFVAFDLSRLDAVAAVVWAPTPTTRQVGILSEGPPLDGPAVDTSVHSVALRLQGNEVLIASAGPQEIRITGATGASTSNAVFAELLTIPARNDKKAEMVFRPQSP